MALTKCKECGKEVSTEANACPNCGALVKAKSVGCGTYIIALIVVLIIIAAFSGTKKNTFSKPVTQSSALSGRPVSTPTPDLPGSQWQYYNFKDEMGKGTVYQAQVSSTNTVDFDFPYSGAQHGTLSLRTHPRYGKDVVFKIEKGQILCRSYDNCTVLVKFDSGKAESFTAIGTADNSTETIFIQNYSRFIEKLLKAKTVRISVNIYQEGAPVFEFDVSNFIRDKYIPNKKSS